MQTNNLSQGWKFKIFKILNFRKFDLKTCSMPNKYHRFKFNRSIVFRLTEIDLRIY